MTSKIKTFDSVSGEKQFRDLQASKKANVSNRSQSQLPVYQKVRALILQIMVSTKNVPGWAKQEKVNRYLGNAMGVMEFVTHANNALSPEIRSYYLNNAIIAMNEIKLGIRILFDLGFIKKTGMGAIIRYEDDVCRQLQGWLNKTKSEIPSRNNDASEEASFDVF